MKKISKYSIEKIQPDISLFPFKNPEIVKKLGSLLPNREEHAIHLDLNVSIKVANAIRRTLLGELKIKALDVDIANITTNDRYIILNELIDRIRLLPLDQTASVGSKYSLSVINTNPDSKIKTVYSENLKAPVPGKFRLAELAPGRSLSIQNVTVKEGYGNQHVMFSLTGDVFFDNLDFKDIHLINSKYNRVTRRVSVADLIKLMSKETPDSLFDKKILVIPKNLVPGARLQSKITNAGYDHILKCEPPSEQSSATTHSKSVRMRIYLKGNIAPELVLGRVCDNLIARLKTISLENYTKSVNINTNDSTVNVWTLDIPGETHTIGELIKYGIEELDPRIPLIKKRLDHPRSTTVHIDIVHSEPKKITADAIAKLVAVFESIKKESTQ